MKTFGGFMTSKQPKINEVLSQSLIRYSQVWEDASILCEGLDINGEDNVLSIGSAGCNAFVMLIAGAKSVVAVDLNPAQIALINLKKQAILQYSLDEYRSLVGVSKEHNPIELYNNLRDKLSESVQLFWDQNFVECGIQTHEKRHCQKDTELTAGHRFFTESRIGLLSIFTGTILCIGWNLFPVN